MRNTELLAVQAIPPSTAIKQILDYLIDHDNNSYTYNELSTILHIAPTVTNWACRQLAAKPNNNVISHKPQNSRKKLVYKYAEDAQFICKYGADKTLKMKVIAKQILKIVEDSPGISANAIVEAVRAYYIQIDRTPVFAALKWAIERKMIIVTSETKGAIQINKHYINDD